MSKRIELAKKYINAGVSVIATDANKRAVQAWKKFELNYPTDEDLKAMFNHPKTEGIAIICGKISGNLEVIDIDCKYDLSGDLFSNFIQEITDANPILAQKLVIAKTKTGGFHIYYRCPVIEGNKKLAQRYTTDEEKGKNPHEKVKVLIETRGQSGYVIAPPTPGYKFTQNSIETIPVITEDERRLLLEVSRSYNKVIEEYKQYEYTEKKAFQKSPFSDYNERGPIVDLLVKHGWRIVGVKGAKTIFLRPGETTSKSSGDYNADMGLFSVFTTSTQFEPNKGYRPAAVFAMLECNNDWKVAAKKLLEMGYGEPYKKVSRDVRSYIIKMQEKGFKDDVLINQVAITHNISPEDAKAAVEAVNKQENEDSFWSWDAEKEKLSLVYTRFVEFLNRQGLGLFFYDKTSPIFKIVRCEDSILEETSTERIKKMVEAYIKDAHIDGVQYTEEMLLELIYRNNNMFTDNIMEYLKPIDIDFLKDDKNTAYIPFNNGIVKITADGIELINHGSIQKVIWRSELLDFNIDIDQDSTENCEFATFVQRISGNDEERFLKSISLIGYILHRFKDPARPFALILGEETEDESKGGGTGKGIFTKAFGYMMPVVTIDGKTFSPSKKNFAYQRIKLNTRAIIIQDVVKNFDFQSLYNLITDGATIEKKNQDELFIPFEDSPKVIVTTNYAVNDEGNHTKRRIKVIEFSDYFHPGHTPEDEFGHLLFNDWDKDEWNRFYNFMFFCIRFYLKNGIIDIQESETYKLKKIRMQFGEDFAEWFNYYRNNGCTTFKPISELRDSFYQEFDIDTKTYSAKRFSKALRTSAQYIGKMIVDDKNIDPSRRLFVKMVDKNTPESM